MRLNRTIASGIAALAFLSVAAPAAQAQDMLGAIAGLAMNAITAQRGGNVQGYRNYDQGYQNYDQGYRQPNRFGDQGYYGRGYYGRNGGYDSYGRGQQGYGQRYQEYGQDRGAYPQYGAQRETYNQYGNAGNRACRVMTVRGTDATGRVIEERRNVCQ